MLPPLQQMEVVDFEDDALGAVVAPLRLVPALHDGEGVQDVGQGVSLATPNGAITTFQVRHHVH